MGLFFRCVGLSFLLLANVKAITSVRQAQIVCEPDHPKNEQTALTSIEQKREEVLKPQPLTLEEKRDLVLKHLLEVADKKGFKISTRDLIVNLKFESKILTSESKQPETSITFAKYREIFTSKKRLSDAKQFMQDNASALSTIEAKYKVDKEIVVALMLMETNLGQRMGSSNLLNSLFSLAIESRRSQFFLKELEVLLTIIDAGNTNITKDSVGSWAGAFGMVQFMPSSFLSFAVDGDGDGIIDIMGNKIDAFASAANYMSKSKWQYGQRVVVPIDTDLSGLNLCETLGRKFDDGVLIAPDIKTKADIHRLDTEFYVAHDNLASILLWNRALFFGVMAGILYDELKK